MGMRKNPLWLGDLCDLHLAPVCDHGDSIQWILHLPALYHGGAGADPCPDLLPGDPSLPGGLCGHAPDWRILSKGVPAGGDRACRVLCGACLLAVQRGGDLPAFLCGGGSVRDQLWSGLDDSRLHPHQPLV